jgi:hypothetical protein
VWCDTTDAGPDQAGRRRQIAAAVADISFILYFHMNCLLHQFHLAAKAGLELIDAFLVDVQQTHPELVPFNKYFSSLAKCANVWRKRVAHKCSI